MDKETKKWLSISFASGVAFSSAIFFSYLLYKLNKKNQDPRIKEVKDLIEEAERLINLGKKK